jgi:hypothetical protein
LISAFCRRTIGKDKGSFLIIVVPAFTPEASEEQNNSAYFNDLNTKLSYWKRRNERKDTAADNCHGIWSG